MLIILTWKHQLRVGLSDLKRIFSSWKPAAGMILASFFISLNWFVFIWAVSNDRVIEASLGYYINPLLNVILSFLFLKERFTRYQVYAIIFAFIGVTIMTSYYGVVPWVAFLLAFSFGVYGLMKKLVQVGAIVGLTIETLLMTPFALLFVIWLYRQPGYVQAFSMGDLTTSGLLIGAGAVTAVPLLLFAIGARRISLSLIGFLQYIGPTIMLFLGIFLYNEPFSKVQFISFIFIWIGLFIFTASKTKLFERLFRKTKQQNA